MKRTPCGTTLRQLCRMPNVCPLVGQIRRAILDHIVVGIVGYDPIGDAHRGAIIRDKRQRLPTGIGPHPRYGPCHTRKDVCFRRPAEPLSSRPHQDTCAAAHVIAALIASVSTPSRSVTVNSSPSADNEAHAIDTTRPFTIGHSHKRLRSVSADRLHDTTLEIRPRND